MYFDTPAHYDDRAFDDEAPPASGGQRICLLGFSAFRSYLKSEINSRKMLPLKSEPLETKKLSPQVAVDARCRQPRPEKNTGSRLRFFHPG